MHNFRFANEHHIEKFREFLRDYSMFFHDSFYNDYAPRLDAWRQECAKRSRPKQFGAQIAIVSALSLQGTASLPIQLRRGFCTRDVLRSLEFELNESMLLMGVPAWKPLDMESRDFKIAQAYLRAMQPAPGQTGHCELDLTRLYQLGINGLRHDLGHRRQNAYWEQRETYQSFLYALNGLSVLCSNAAATALAAMPAASAARRAELNVIAESCLRIAHHPPATFRDVGLVVPGRLDLRLISFYQRDVAAGLLTPSEALALLENLYLLINEVVPEGLAVSVMVGGRNAQGRDVTNDLSYLCLEALRRTKLVYPTVGVCWHEGTPAALTDLTVELIGNGYSTPAFFGDETIQRGLKHYGVPPRESCNYINSTCVEITPSGSSNVWVASPYFPTCKFLLEEIQAQAMAPAATFDGFLAAYQARLAEAIRQAVATENNNRKLRQLNGRKPFQSLFTRDCIERGHDIDDGGARYNWVECSFVGLANLADSLYVIQEEIYNLRTLSMAELLNLLNSNFEGHEAERLRFLKKYPKYGINVEAVDHFVRDTVAFVTQECARYTMLPDDSHFIPGAFCWIMHEYLGRESGATPDGRKAGFPFADGAGPAQGRETSGPTAAILSTTSWDASPFIGGVALNMKFNSSLFTSPEAFQRLRDLIITYLRRGGFETQVNVVDHAMLQKAKENPDDYRDLVVRIGGYTDYFTRLSPEMQAEVMLRTEYQAV